MLRAGPGGAGDPVPARLPRARGCRFGGRGPPRPVGRGRTGSAAPSWEPSGARRGDGRCGGAATDTPSHPRPPPGPCSPSIGRGVRGCPGGALVLPAAPGPPTAPPAGPSPERAGRCPGSVPRPGVTARGWTSRHRAPEPLIQAPPAAARLRVSRHVVTVSSRVSGPPSPPAQPCRHPARDLGLKGRAAFSSADEEELREGWVFG